MSARGSASWRAIAWGPACDATHIVKATILGIGTIWCDRRTIPAWEQLGRVFRMYGYHVREDVTGCYNCRKITGGTVPSAHSWGIALDANWDTNPYRHDRVVTDVPPALVAAATGIRTLDGVQVFRWGGDWDGRPDTPQSNYDAMHWEVIATPDELAAGFALPAPDPADARTWFVLRPGMRGDAVASLQRELPSLTADGVFGPVTRQAVIQYQQSRGIPADATVGLSTWTALFTHQPALVAGVAPPTKGAAAA